MMWLILTVYCTYSYGLTSFSNPYLSLPTFYSVWVFSESEPKTEERYKIKSRLHGLEFNPCLLQAIKETAVPGNNYFPFFLLTFKSPHYQCKFFISFDGFDSHCIIRNFKVFYILLLLLLFCQIILQYQSSPLVDLGNYHNWKSLSLSFEEE